MNKNKLQSGLAASLWDRAQSSVTLRILGLLLMLWAGTKLLDAGFIELNRRRIVLPQFNVKLIPYHDPRVTTRHSLLLAYPESPRVIFTGDSRVKNGIVPQAIAAASELPNETFFNFGTGSQVVKFARFAFLPHLLEMGIKPEFLIFGVSPDWPLEKRRLWGLIDNYRNSLAYRMNHLRRRPRDFETFLKQFLSRRLALFRYRQDLIHQELLLDWKCWAHGDCLRLHSSMEEAIPLHFKDAERRSGYKTPYGWGPQPYDGHSKGRFMGRARFGRTMPFDQTHLGGLIRETKAAGVIPLLLIMPVHPSFREKHEPAMSLNEMQLRESAEQLEVGLLDPQGDYSDPRLFVDGHHLSHFGAVAFSIELAELLARYLKPQESSAASDVSPRQVAPDALLQQIYATHPEIPKIWGR